MYYIKASVKDQNLIVPEMQSVNGTARVIACRFTFDKSWEHYTAKTAIFGHQLLGEVEMDIIGNECEVPKEILIKSGIISLAVKGSTPDGEVQRTETQPIIKQKCTLQSGKNAVEPTPDQYAQFVAAVDEKLKDKQDTLIAGDGIKIVDNVISTDGSTSIFEYIKKIETWLYEVSFLNSDYDFAYNYMNNRYMEIPMGACSLVYKNGLIGANLDLPYSNCEDFIVRSSGNGYTSIGAAGGIPQLSKEFVESGKVTDIYKILPFMINSGVNEHGVFVKMNIVPSNDTKGGEPFSTITTGTHPELKPTCAFMLPKMVLDRCANADEAITLIDNTNVYCPNKTYKNEMHLFVSDSEKQYIVEFINNETKVIDVTDAMPWMTNYYRYGAQFNDDGTVKWETLTDHATGVKRNDIIADNYDDLTTVTKMKLLMSRKLKYTHAYIHSEALIDEFVYNYGDEFGDLTLEKAMTHPELFDGVIEYYKNIYLERDRNDPITWQTEHSCVYDIPNKKLYITVQENGVSHEFSFGKAQTEIVPATKTTLGGVMVGDNLLIDEEGRLSVDTADAVEADNTKPITSAAVHVEVGNINEVLKVI